jgi:tetratricopeptide (TPR) repeat protein
MILSGVGIARRLPRMKVVALLALIFSAVSSISGQTAANDGNFQLALPSHQGQLQWHADGFKVVQSSAKPKGTEIGIRGKDESGKITFLGFLFLVSGQSPLTGLKCRDGALQLIKKGNPSLKILTTSEISVSKKLPIELVAYSARGEDGKPIYSVRGFVATGDICGDLELYSDAPIGPEGSVPKQIFQSYGFNPDYSPEFNDVFLYAQILYRNGMYKAAAPIFEQSLTKLKDDKSQETWRRVATDQAGMSYGISGDITKARSIFESAVAKDPDYPLYYYNLACADAEENKLTDAKVHLQQAFARKDNVIPGESLPDPSKDDSFLRHSNNKEFWDFVTSLH